jgi:hypothetical protein
VTVLPLVWLHVEKQPASKLASHASLTCWYLLVLAADAADVSAVPLAAGPLRRFGIFLLP